VQNQKDFALTVIRGVTGCGCALFLAAVLYPIFMQEKGPSPGSRCLSNAKILGLGLKLYQEDYDDHFPQASEWMDATLPYVKDKVRYHCPSLDNSHADDFGYAFNSSLSLQRLDRHASPEKVVMLYDASDLHWNAHAPNRSGAANPPRHHGKDIFAYADGHAKIQSLPGQQE